MKVTVTIDRMREIPKAIKALSENRTMVGIPGDKNIRKGEAIGNAALGYIHENGAPEVNIPARPFLKPGVKSVQIEITTAFKKMGEFAFSGELTAVMKGFHVVGLIGQNAVRKTITDRIPPPLSPRTIANRKRKHKGRIDPNPVPLIDTSQMLRSITYVVRKENAKP